MQVTKSHETRDWSLTTDFARAIESLLHPLPAATSSSLFAVALSGGADSMALALLAHQWAQSQSYPMIALTIDHGLRAESRAEAQQVAAWMKAHNIAHHILTPPLTNDSNNLQENARQRRYDALAEYCREHDILHCLVAHQAGDVRETVALNTERGNTADGSSGMAATRNYRGVRFVRPLLNFERAELENFLREQQATWIEDPSNRNENFARVRMRQQLAEDQNFDTALSAIASMESVARAARDHALAETAMRLVSLHPLGFATIDLAAWQTLDTLLASQLIADCLTSIGGNIHRPRKYETDWLANALHQPFRKRTLHHCEITVSKNTIHIARELARVENPVTLVGTGELIWDRRFSVRYNVPKSSPLTLRALRHDGKKQLAAKDITLPLSTPSLWHLDELLCVPHMNHAPRALPSGAQVTIGFAPPKPLAAAPFWCLNSRIEQE